MSLERLTVEELKAFTKAARGEEDERELLLRTLVRTGPRLYEVINLRVEDVSLAEGHLTFRNPNSSVSRQVPLVEPLFTELRGYVEWRDSGFVFEEFGGDRRNAWRVARLVRQTAKKAGIERRVGVGTIRHSVAHLLAERGGATIEQIGALLGHVDTETTTVPMVRFLEV
jgi:integrase/recombinase XerD